MKAIQRLLVLGIIFSFGMSASACLNGFEPFFSRSYQQSLKSIPVPHGHPVDTKSKDVRFGLSKMKSGLEKGDFEAAVDYCLYLIYDKQYKEAEKECRKVLKKWPQKYESAANLGTILEVNGKHKEALKWIKRSIEINPESHGGSEWIHVKILEAKLSPDVAWTGPEMTGFNFGQDSLPNSGQDSSTLAELQKHLFYQLNERVTFIQPEDPFIAALMFELGNVTFTLSQMAAKKKTNHIKLEVGQSAPPPNNMPATRGLYNKAKMYGFSEPLLEMRMAAAKEDWVKIKPVDTVAGKTELSDIQPPEELVQNPGEEKSEPHLPLPLIIVIAVIGAVGSWFIGKVMMKK